MENVIFTLLEALDIPKEKYYELAEDKKKEVQQIGEEIISFFQGLK